jgi:hypothetical protein
MVAAEFLVAAAPLREVREHSSSGRRLWAAAISARRALQEAQLHVCEQQLVAG